jgi:hypothetical protein
VHVAASAPVYGIDLDFSIADEIEVRVRQSAEFFNYRTYLCLATAVFSAAFSGGSLPVMYPGNIG